MELKNSKILITGGTLGIGKETAKQLIAAGAKVAITGRDSARVEAAAQELDCLGVTADVSKQNDVDRTYSEFLDRFGGIDCLINNAGIGKHSSLLDLNEADFRSVWEVNVLGATLMAQGAARLFVKQNFGTIVNIASTASLKGYAGGTIYSSSKFALRSMSECWRAELRKHNVRVIQINPSEVPTAFGNAERVERAEQDGKLTVREIAHSIRAALEMDQRGFIPELTVFATNPF